MGHRDILGGKAKTFKNSRRQKTNARASFKVINFREVIREDFRHHWVWTIHQQDGNLT